MIYEIEWTESSRGDYNGLDGSQRTFVDKALKKTAFWEIIAVQKIKA
jgi:hypothetical protein